jgi:hypothetical protein
MAHVFRLLRPRRERPRGSRAAEQCDELAAPHSITSSARATSVEGTVSPNALAVLRLTTNSNLVGSWTGQVARLGSLENPIDISRGSAKQFNVAGRVRKESPGIDILPVRVHRGQQVCRREFDDALSVSE